MESRSYTISIRNVEFTFICSDGQDHVDQLEACLNRWVDRLYPGSALPHMSDFTFKLAISLADEAISQGAALKKQVEDIEGRLSPLLVDMDRAIFGPGGSNEELEVGELGRPVEDRTFESEEWIE